MTTLAIKKLYTPGGYVILVSYEGFVSENPLFSSSPGFLTVLYPQSGVEKKLLRTPPPVMHQMLCLEMYIGDMNLMNPPVWKQSTLFILEF